MLSFVNKSNVVNHFHCHTNICTAQFNFLLNKIKKKYPKMSKNCSKEINFQHYVDAVKHKEMTWNIFQDLVEDLSHSDIHKMKLLNEILLRELTMNYSDLDRLKYLNIIQLSVFKNHIQRTDDQIEDDLITDDDLKLIKLKMIKLKKIQLKRMRFTLNLFELNMFKLKMIKLKIIKLKLIKLKIPKLKMIELRR